jgi:hypothetical protein
MPIKCLKYAAMAVFASLFISAPVALAVSPQEGALTQPPTENVASQVHPSALMDAQVSAVVSTGSKSKVQALLTQAASTHNVELEAALLAHAESKDEIKEHESPVQVMSSSARNKAHASRISCYPWSFSDRHTIGIAGVNLAWEEVIVGGFCWNGTRITWYGGAHSRRWSAAPYCWKDTSNGQYYTYYPKWMRAYSSGTVGGNAIWGCISLQGDNAWLEYANGGGIFRH